MPVLSPEQLVVGYQAASDATRDRVLEYVRRVWSASTSFRDADVDRIVSRIVPVVQAGQLNAARLTEAYMAQMATLSGVDWASDAIDRTAIVDYRGVPADEVYRRPAVTVYTALSEGKAFPAAVDLGLVRLLAIASDDIQQSRNRQAAAAIGRSGFQSFRRQLTGRESCALCTIAASHLYTRGDLMPIHTHCDCAVVPGSKGATKVADDLLKRVHADVARFVTPEELGKPASDHSDLVVTNVHGELGPVLGWAGDDFTGPSDIARAAGNGYVSQAKDFATYDEFAAAREAERAARAA